MDPINLYSLSDNETQNCSKAAAALSMMARLASLCPSADCAYRRLTLYSEMHPASIAVWYCTVFISGMREATPNDF